MTNDLSVLEVLLHGRPIGTLTNVLGDQSLFAFNRDYAGDENRPIFSLSFVNELGGLITAFNPTQTKLHPFFSNLLPEGALRDYLARHANVKQSREFFLLWALGQDLPGAVRVAPYGSDALPSVDDWDDDEWSKEMQQKMLRFSLAGVQLKFSALKNSGKNGGLAIPVRGQGGEWIVKLPSMKYEGVPENEFSMMYLASTLGMDVPEIQLLPLDKIDRLPQDIGALSGEAFAIRRFDRTPEGPVHIEDFAQVFGMYPDDKYKSSYRSIANVLAIETDDNSQDEFIRRVVFNTLIGNGDMHLKNWSLIYPDRRNAKLSPAYDFVSTVPYLSEDQSGLKYARTRRMQELTYQELAHLAAKARLPERRVLQVARETVQAFMALWPQEKRHLPMRRHVADAIDAHLTTLPILKIA